MDLSWMLEPPFDELVWFLVSIGGGIVGLIVLVPVLILLKRFLAWWIELWEDLIG